MKFIKVSLWTNDAERWQERVVSLSDISEFIDISFNEEESEGNFKTLIRFNSGGKRYIKESIEEVWNILK